MFAVVWVVRVAQTTNALLMSVTFVNAICVAVVEAGIV